MFTTEVTGLTLASEAANALFPNITGTKHGRDETFVATLRALMYDRVSKEESIRVETSSSRYNKEDIEGAKPKDCMKAFLRGSLLIAGKGGIIHIHSVDSAESEACFGILDKAVEDTLDGYSLTSDITEFFKQKKVMARFYQNAELGNTLIFIERLDMKKWHFLQAFIPRYYAKHFADKPLTPEELALTKTLLNRYAPGYREAIEAYTEKFDFRTPQIRSMLKGFESQFERAALDSVRRDISSIRDTIHNLQTEFSRHYTRLNDLFIREAGLEQRVRCGPENEEESEILQFFIRHKNIELIRAQNGSLEFVVKTYLTNYDPEAFESVFRNERSYIYNEPGNSEFTRTRVKSLLKAIFADEKFKLKMCAAYLLNFSSGEYRALGGYSYPASVTRNHEINPHIHHYSCLGSFNGIIASAMEKRDYVAAISSCCASAANMNFAESMTAGRMIGHLFGAHAGKCIEMPDGTNVTPIEAVKWLEAQEADKAKSVEEEVTI